LKYQLCDEKGNSHAVGHLLSPKDLNTIQLLPELAAAGAGSLKIEGRMKRPEYVAAVTAAYAAAKRGEPYDERALLQAFNRGFTSAYLQNEPGHDMMSYERPNNRGTRLGRIEKIEPEALVLKLEAPLSVGDGLEIWVSRGGRQGFDVREFAEISPGRVRLPLHGLPVQVRNLSVGDRIFKTSDSRLNEQGEAAYAAYDTMPLSLHFVGRLGKQPVLTASYGDVTAEVAADYEIPLAEKRPADLALLEKQLGRLGGSGWHLAGLTADFDEGIMLPASVLNNLRRSAVLALEDKLLAKYDRTELAPRRERVSAVNAADSAEYAKVSRKQRARLAVAADSLEAAEAAVMAGADYVYWRAWGSKFQPQPDKNALARLAGLNAPVLAMLPTMAFESELAVWRKRLAAYRESGLAGVLVANLWGYKLLRELDWQPEIVADFALNSFNAEAAALWRQFGADRVALSHELNREQLRELCGITKMQTEVQVFGNLEVMNSRHCPIGALCGGKESGKACDGACRRGSYHLRDEKGFCFPVRTDEFCRSHIYNGYQLCLIEDVPELAAVTDVLRLDLQYYQPSKVAEITAIFAEALAAKRRDKAELADMKEQLAEVCGVKSNKFTKGHYYRGVE
jgi:putative protease